MGISRKGVPNRKYSDRQKAEAIALVMTSQRGAFYGRVAEVAAQLNIPVETLRFWVNGKLKPVDEETQREVNAELMERFDKEIDAIFEQMEVKRDRAMYRDLVIGLGIIFDKKQLINGGATENIQQQITVVRQGNSTLPAHLARLPVADDSGEEEV